MLFYPQVSLKGLTPFGRGQNTSCASPTSANTHLAIAEAKMRVILHLLLSKRSNAG